MLPDTHIDNLSFASINCNSLNMSAINKNLQKNKLYGITKLKADVIFLSDIRLSNRNLTSNIDDICRTFLINPYCSYRFLFNSSQNKRGTGILIKNNILFTEFGRAADEEENFLAIMAEIKGNKMVLCSIYGPNAHNPNFFTRLKRAIQSFNCRKIIIGGDWNCTYSTEPIASNIDCLNMVAVPNIRHSKYVKNLCETLELTDPYRGFSPLRKDFTYVTRNLAKNNRSRIDFFLTSEDLFVDATSCDILPGLQSNLFDHKAIFLDFYPKKTGGIKGPSISNSILKESDLEIVVRTATIECYIHHIDIDRTPLVQFGRELLLNEVGEIWVNLRRAGPDPVNCLPGTFSDEEIHQRRALLQGINDWSNRFDIDELQNYPLITNNIIFMETLLNCIRNEVSSFQHFVFEAKKKKKQDTLLRIKEIKNVSPLDEQLLHENEKILNTILNDELIAMVEKSPLFDHLHNEKLSPVFLKLAKNLNVEAKLSDIVDPNGMAFANSSERDEYIVSYFANTYKKPEGDTYYNGCIVDFLGHEICLNPVVTGSKLTDEQANSLEGEITLNELDTSIKEAKLRTAGGADGISNAFLKKFWRYFRVPLCNYANECFENGTLSKSFNTGSIRLIPKKGDITNIKNWRPISLLNCIYKIISRAINNRLKKVMDTITSRAQKGFTSSRFIQEVLINVIENIAYCKANRIPACVVAIDQAKAFDSLNHDFLAEAYRFFGFKDNFIRMLSTISTGRSSCIILEDNSYSRPFPIETGAMQGDAPSPSIFNIGEQILLFRLEFDPEIASIFLNHIVPRPFFPSTEPNFSLEANRESEKVDAYADDTTGYTLAEISSLRAVKNNLLNFGLISGLKCNFEKTNIMAIGDRTAVTPDLAALNIPFVDKVKILGLEIDYDLKMLKTVHNLTIEKIRKTALL